MYSSEVIAGVSRRISRWFATSGGRQPARDWPRPRRTCLVQSSRTSAAKFGSDIDASQAGMADHALELEERAAGVADRWNVEPCISFWAHPPILRMSRFAHVRTCWKRGQARDT